DVDRLLTGLQHLRFQGHEVTIFHVLHPDELEFPFTGMTEFRGLEEPTKLRTRPQLIRPAYMRALRDFTDRLQRGCEAQRCDYVLMNTGKSLGSSLAAYLAMRLRVRRV